jgi:hypothetical protein
MAIRTIEVVCKPCPKCHGIEAQIKNLVNSIGKTKGINIVYSFTHTTDLKGMADLGMNPGVTPVIRINGQVELAGKIDLDVMRKRLEAIHMMG